MINWKKVQQTALSARYRSNPRPDEISNQEARELPDAEPVKKSGSGLTVIGDSLLKALPESGKPVVFKKSLDALDYSARLVLGDQRGQSKTVRLTVGSTR